MKKKNVINLIKYHVEKNDIQFRNEAIEISRSFNAEGDYQLSEYIVNLLSTTNTLVPQDFQLETRFLKKISNSSISLPLPVSISSDIKGIINAINHNVGINKFLLEGSPGTGKTESVKQIARLLNRQIYGVEFSSLIDSKLGQTNKNIVELFVEINKLPFPEQIIILFDEIDSIALDRINSNDLREMGRATSTILKQFDELSPNIVLIATTNLYAQLDKALSRRFDSIINFDRYSEDDIVEIAEKIFNSYAKKFPKIGRNIKLFKKIIRLINPMPMPGDLSNMIKTALAFSDINSDFDYLRRLYGFTDFSLDDVETMKLNGLTVREIEILTGISKSQVSRELKEE
ncbi:ATP-binding protein [Leuconostoc mesenteroides]|uniref:ATP-binding protein n=1 Tax=Leuconostoc mesenteroides TaxID=1245 RepID=UPI001CC10DA5|nr:ATP-binding protein [Leuconostoc mesenteroides]MBZ1513203.1 AAA family ATPase [Leuconostoc mesenteroides]